MKITSVSMNRPLNKAQGTVKKISPLVKPSTMAVREVDDHGPAPDAELSANANGNGQRKSSLDTLGSEVDVWV